MNSANTWAEPVTLQGKVVTLVPLQQAHEEELRAALQEGDLANVWYARIPTPETIGAEIRRRLALAERGEMLPFTVIDSNSGKTIGMTSYQLLDEANKRVEIGFTWYCKSAQRTAANTEAKLLLLSHAFEQLGAIAVGFKTNFFNRESRRAIERLGAKLDGVLRNHMILDGGIIRDTCYYSIIQNEWQAVKVHLRWLLNNKYG
ncbi:GNAT family N-acetyltransferase [Carnimonas bestiolae]|uniref:GNAT family N-acetyltransferase n=1 Tax=Carnimonas bestiolae TaxID=3402172 RepID=UPI003EDC1B0C